MKRVPQEQWRALSMTVTQGGVGGCYREEVTSSEKPASGKRASKQQMSAARPAMTQDGVPIARIRRAPNPLAFLLVGGVLGAIAGLVASSFGDDGSYQGTSASAYFLVFFGALGALLGGVVFALLDRRS